jgi:hypothetical protein
MSVAKRLSIRPGRAVVGSLVLFGVAVAVVYSVELSRLWLLAAAIAINAIVTLVRVYRPVGRGAHRRTRTTRA